jgi:hypothetical protein
MSEQKPFNRRSFLTGSLIGGAGGLLAGAAATYSLVEKDFPSSLRAIETQEAPRRRLLTITDDPCTSVGLTWRTDYVPVAERVEVIAVSADPSFDRDETAIVRVNSTKEELETLDGRTVYYHHATVRGLQPATEYAWRIVEKRGYTEWNHFRTAALTPEPFKFLFLGDAQNSLNLRWPRVIRAAHGKCPDAQLLLHAGDLVNVADSDEEWRDWFSMAGWIHGSAPCLAVPGNHEYATPTGNVVSRITPFWAAQFRTRPTGLDANTDLRGAMWMLDWQGVRFIGLNSMRDTMLQAEWLQNVALADNPNRWTVVMFHHPLHSCVRTRDNPLIRAMWEPILDDARVDLVLQGHDHAYSRTGKVQGSLLQPDHAPGRVYVTSVSGAKMYQINSDRTELFQKLCQDRQMYQVAEVNGNVLRMEAWMVDGTLFDAFELHKQSDGETVLKTLV